MGGAQRAQLLRVLIIDDLPTRRTKSADRNKQILWKLYERTKKYIIINKYAEQTKVPITQSGT